MQRDDNLFHKNNGQQIDAIQMSYRKTVGGLHQPIWSTGGSSRPDADHIQD